MKIKIKKEYLINKFQIISDGIEFALIALMHVAIYEMLVKVL